jgi:hypothetical protein
MRKLFLHISAVSAALLFCLACSQDKSTVIPRGKMSKIYAEMLVMDQWAVSESDLRTIADTSLVYEPIFQKYGYDTEDYRKSVEHYMKDPERFSRILRATSEILEARIVEIKELKRLYLRQVEISGFVTDFNIGEYFPYLSEEPYVHYYDSLSIQADSGYVYRLVSIERADTLYDLLRMIVPADSIVVVDTLAIEVEKQDDAPVVKDVKEVEEIAAMDLEGHAKGFVKKTARKSDGESGIILQSKLDSQKKK